MGQWMTSKCLDNYEQKAPRWLKKIMRVGDRRSQGRGYGPHVAYVRGPHVGTELIVLAKPHVNCMNECVNGYCFIV